jgi:hypothetical protein
MNNHMLLFLDALEDFMSRTIVNANIKIGKTKQQATNNNVIPSMCGSVLAFEHLSDNMFITDVRKLPDLEFYAPQTKILEVRTNIWERIFEVLF